MEEKRERKREREQWVAAGREGVKKRQEKANIKSRWAGDTAISGTGRKKSARLRRLKKELAKRSLRLMCREEARAWERRLLVCGSFRRCGDAVRCAAARTPRWILATRRDDSSRCLYLFCVGICSDLQKERLICKSEVGKKHTLLLPLNN